jgi:PTS system mannose-specific IIA component
MRKKGIGRTAGMAAGIRKTRFITRFPDFFLPVRRASAGHVGIVYQKGNLSVLNNSILYCLKEKIRKKQKNYRNSGLFYLKRKDFFDTQKLARFMHYIVSRNAERESAGVRNLIRENDFKGGIDVFGIIVGTHGHFSEQLVKSCEMIMGEQKNVRAVTLVPGEGLEDVTRKYQEAIGELDAEDGILFLNDLMGGSPYNAASQLVARNPSYGIVAGANLPMLIELVTAQLTYDGESILQLMDRAAQAGQDGVKKFHASQLESNSDEEEDEL